MSKRVLIINDEWTAKDPGVVPAGTLPGVQRDFHIVTNLEEVIRTLTGYITCVVFHQDVTPELLEDLKPDYIVASGRWKDWDEMNLDREYAVAFEALRAAKVPVLGICAGHQLIPVAFGGRVGKMVESEAPVREVGYTTIRSKADPLFAGLPLDFRCMMAHRDEVKELPPEFETIASTDICPCAALRHKTRPIWGVQFHPEVCTPEEQDGIQIMLNFFSK